MKNLETMNSQRRKRTIFKKLLTVSVWFLGSVLGHIGSFFAAMVRERNGSKIRQRMMAVCLLRDDCKKRDRCVILQYTIDKRQH